MCLELRNTKIFRISLSDRTLHFLFKKLGFFKINLWLLLYVTCNIAQNIHKSFLFSQIAFVYQDNHEYCSQRRKESNLKQQGSTLNSKHYIYCTHLSTVVLKWHIKSFFLLISSYFIVTQRL